MLPARAMLLPLLATITLQLPPDCDADELDEAAIGMCLSYTSTTTEYYDGPMNYGIPPWKCGPLDTGPFFLDCDRALDLRDWVFCNLSCDCQKNFEDLFNNQCQAFGHADTNCGTTCLCIGDENWNPFAQNCNCQTEVAYRCEHLQLCHCGAEEQCYQHCPYTPEQQEIARKQFDDLHCADLPRYVAGVSPGPRRFPPANCAPYSGCKVDASKNPMIQCYNAPTAGVPATGTTGIGFHVGS